MGILWLVGGILATLDGLALAVMNYAGTTVIPQPDHGGHPTPPVIHQGNGFLAWLGQVIAILGAGFTTLQIVLMMGDDQIAALRAKFGHVPSAAAPGSPGGAGGSAPNRAPASIARPKGSYDAATGKVTVTSEPPSGWELAVYWTPASGATVQPGRRGGLTFGRTREAEIGTGATNIRVQFVSDDRKQATELIPVP